MKMVQQLLISNQKANTGFLWLVLCPFPFNRKKMTVESRTDIRIHEFSELTSRWWLVFAFWQLKYCEKLKLFMILQFFHFRLQTSLYLTIKCVFFNKVVHLRQRLDNAVSSSRDRAFPIEATLTMIQTLIDCDEFQDIATLRVILLNISSYSSWSTHWILHLYIVTSTCKEELIFPSLSGMSTFHPSVYL